MPHSAKTSVLSLQSFVDTLEESTVQDQLDLGESLVYRANHPKLGNIILVNTTGTKHGLLRL